MSSCYKPLKTDPFGEIRTCTYIGLFYQMQSLINDLCLLLLNLKMPITIDNQGFIWNTKECY